MEFCVLIKLPLRRIAFCPAVIASLVQSPLHPVPYLLRNYCAKLYQHISCGPGNGPLGVARQEIESVRVSASASTCITELPKLGQNAALKNSLGNTIAQKQCNPKALLFAQALYCLSATLSYLPLIALSRTCRIDAFLALAKLAPSRPFTAPPARLTLLATVSFSNATSSPGPSHMFSRAVCTVLALGLLSTLPWQAAPPYR